MLTSLCRPVAKRPGRYSKTYWCILGGASGLYVARSTAQATASEAEEEGRERVLVKDDILH